MRHRSNKYSFGRKLGPRRALIRGLVDALVEHGRIRTTLPKAKIVRGAVEKAITKGKTPTLHTRRNLLEDFPNQGTVAKILSDLSVRFKKRPGGYTRILRLGARPGDCAEMAYIEFVDYKPTEKGTAETVKGDKNAKKVARQLFRKQKALKKSVRQMRDRSRREHFAAQK